MKSQEQCEKRERVRAWAFIWREPFEGKWTIHTDFPHRMRHISTDLTAKGHSNYTTIKWEATGCERGKIWEMHIRSHLIYVTILFPHKHTFNRHPPFSDASFIFHMIICINGICMYIDWWSSASLCYHQNSCIVISNHYHYIHRISSSRIDVFMAALNCRLTFFRCFFFFVWIMSPVLSSSSFFLSANRTLFWNEREFTIKP